MAETVLSEQVNETIKDTLQSRFYMIIQQTEMRQQLYQHKMRAVLRPPCEQGRTESTRYTPPIRLPHLFLTRPSPIYNGSAHVFRRLQGRPGNEATITSKKEHNHVVDVLIYRMCRLFPDIMSI